MASISARSVAEMVHPRAPRFSVTLRAADFPAPKPERRNLEAGLAELPIFHAS
jgi:hypothetical protein